jgi:DNA-directed RNA polymerase beta' subunit
LKTADAGYPTRRHDVSQDVIVNIEDCGTLRGVEVSALKRKKKWLNHWRKNLRTCCFAGRSKSFN